MGREEGFSTGGRGWGEWAWTGPLVGAASSHMARVSGRGGRGGRGRVIATCRNGGYGDVIVPAAGGDEAVRGGWWPSKGDFHS